MLKIRLVHGPAFLIIEPFEWVDVGNRIVTACAHGNEHPIIQQRTDGFWYLDEALAKMEPKQRVGPWGTFSITDTENE